MSVAAPAATTMFAAQGSRIAFALGFVGLAISAAVLSGALPITFAFATVFLFAGPHNWFEARYALGRLPARAGKLWGFFLASVLGIVGLSAGYAALPFAVSRISDAHLGLSLYAGWATVFLFWVALLVWMRSHTNPRFDGGWVWPAACLVCAGAWLNPVALPIALVYLHPLMALWLLDRELARSRPAWRRTYWCAVASVPLLLLALWWHLRDAPELPGTDQITLAFAPQTLSAETLTAHAGAWALPGVSPHFLVAAHTFLEMMHYGVWVVLIPLVGMRSWPWQLKTIPAARRSRSWARGIAAILTLGVLIVAVLWVCFGIDYETTRRVYFTVAMIHVLAEVPFLLRMM
ncbi:Uncharacterized protein OS=Pirellula staleyi (strain ATCC 27377 / DSM 6068 / ICPB 4128) GN=Psta_4565 PE=4 SV=1 [Gemmata massiliana]|uniref:Uncharacterized protein n=1 Tax=Gemmata massiliana TaxID=1210884 RepID=A0A6P2DH29_9BACT|nr:hypothetical protein [Gemmata massiliana]VTS00343.1 Uncharacterized protein OS=Pirellula staleyi (strain ATCC 27377 / DSM 6068 / ICPB 4128) GN=Psta_4565 PE=4 SV=1 [Gemmata massiliana]